MAEVIELFGDCVYECKCGSQDFWVIPPPDADGFFDGFVCQGCERNFAFPEYIKRLEEMFVTPIE